MASNRKHKRKDDGSGNGGAPAARLAGSPQRRAAGPDAGLVLATRSSAVHGNPSVAASTKALAKKLKAIGSTPVAISDLAGQRRSDYAKKKRKAAAANRAAKLRQAGIVVHTGPGLSPRVLALMEAAAVSASAAFNAVRNQRALIGGK